MFSCLIGYSLKDPLSVLFREVEQYIYHCFIEHIPICVCPIRVLVLYRDSLDPSLSFIGPQQRVPVDHLDDKFVLRGLKVFPLDFLDRIFEAFGIQHLPFLDGAYTMHYQEKVLLSFVFHYVKLGSEVIR
jgi:hypothetical protein